LDLRAQKSQIQALDRTAPMLPRPGLPERRTHDYIRHGTTTCWLDLVWIPCFAGQN
jgi:hypothetical protein